MDKKFGLGKALEIAKLIQTKESELRTSAALMNSFHPRMFFNDFVPDSSFETVSHIFEILVFGSVARMGDHEVGDIDLIVLDDGSFSCKFASGCVTKDWYDELMENLPELLYNFLECSEFEIEQLLGDIKVDLHVLPLEMLKSDSLRKEIAEKHKDPNFLQNAFSSLLRLDGIGFVPIKLEYFEAKYDVDLSDLKN